MRLAITAMFLLGCLQPQLVPCGDKFCYGDTTCVADHCAAADQVEACSAIADGETCTFSGAVGRCDRGVCIASGCGNLVVDPDEICDDGNVISGDGCRGDCRKIEVCGDAIVDDGEGCDDGNLNAADGCDLCSPLMWTATTIIGGNAIGTATALAFPYDVAVDRFGNRYIADTDQNRIRRLDSNGVMTVIAGTGTAGFDGDGGPATAARLQSPAGLAVDGIGNVFVADLGNNRIRRIDTEGVIITIAGTGAQGFSGDGGFAVAARLSIPSGVAVDGLGNVYIADQFNNRVRQVDLNGVITTIAGNGTQGFSGDGNAATSAQLYLPFGVAVVDDNLFIADSNNYRVRLVQLGAGTITTVAGNGASSFNGDNRPATSAGLRPVRVAVDGMGGFYVADQNDRIRHINSSGVITTVAGTGSPGFSGDGGPATLAALREPVGMARAPDGVLVIADRSNNRMRQVDTAGVITTVAGTGAYGFVGDGGPATTPVLGGPRGVAVDAAGNIYFAEVQGHRIRRIDPSGVITTVAGTGLPGFSGDGGPATAAQLLSPADVAVAGSDLYIADANNTVIRRVASNGVITTVAGMPGVPGETGDGGPATSATLAYPSGLTVAGGSIYIADTGNDRVRRVDANGTITTVAGIGTPGLTGDGGPATSAQLYTPIDVTVDGAGNVFIVDQRNHRIRKVDTNGVISTVAGTTSGFTGDGGAATSAQLNQPHAAVIDANGSLYIAEEYNRRVRRVTNGIITTFAGTGSFGFDGDGGPAINAQFDGPVGLAIDGTGRVIVAVKGENSFPLFPVIRRVETNGRIFTIAGALDPPGTSPLASAALARPQALVVATPFTLFAGGNSGVVQAVRNGSGVVEVFGGRYPQATQIGNLARFRNRNFGSVEGVAYDAATNRILLTEANRIHAITIVDPADVKTWTIATLANASDAEGFSDGALSDAMFRRPSGLYYDAPRQELYVADTGNHIVRVIDLSTGMIRTLAGVPQLRGYFGEHIAATSALLFAPTAITRCDNGDVFIADTGNHRIRRIAAGTNVITTVLGVGVPGSAGEGAPASSYPVDTPKGLACDAVGNLFVTSSTTVRLVPANDQGIVDGSGPVQTIYGAPPRNTFPASASSCLTGLAVIGPTTLRIVDACTGLLVELERQPVP